MECLRASANPHNAQRSSFVTELSGLPVLTALGLDLTQPVDCEPVVR
jgi:hypothetical protein